MATAAILNPRQTVRRNFGARFAAWQRLDTDRRRDEMAALTVLHADPDMLLRIVRAALDGLSGYREGHDTAVDGLDLIQAEFDREDARQMGRVS